MKHPPPPRGHGREPDAILGRAIARSAEAVILIGDAWTIASWNRGAAATFGYPESRIVGKPLSVLVPDFDARSIPGGGPDHWFELDARRQGGAKIRIAVTLDRLPRNDTGLKYLMVARDVTAQVRFEEELSLKYEKLSDAYNQFGIIRRQMDYMFELADLCSENDDLKALCDYIVSSVIMLSRVDACTLRLYDERTDAMKLMSSFGVPEHAASSRVIEFTGSLAQKSFVTRRPIKVIDIAGEPLYRSARWAKLHNFTSALVIALSFRGAFVGSMNLYVTAEKKLELFENTFVERYSRLLGIILAKSRGRR